MGREHTRDTVKQTRAKLFEDFANGVSPDQLLQQYSLYIDHCLQQIGPKLENFALFAIGGYGRKELFPYSDIDFIIVHPNTVTPAPELIGEFLTTLWDIGLEPSHQVLSPETAITLESDDLEFYTSLGDRRFLFGNTDLRDEFLRALAENNPHTPAQFLNLKQKECKQRYHKFDDTVSQLEPNIKQSPGGLRDIQTLKAVAQKMSEANSQTEWFSPSEAQSIQTGFQFLAKIRFGLQSITQKRDDRLLFQHQTELARLLGYGEDPSNASVTLFMQEYFQNAHEISVLVRMLLRHFASADHKPKEIVSINDYFDSIDDYLETKNTTIFKTHPECLLEIFYCLSEQDCDGIGVNTLRQIRQFRDGFTEQVSQKKECREWFKQILASPQKVSETLNQMHDCGILERYCPDFKHIVGRMQYDLYHSFTVDTHILRLLSRLEQFGAPDEFTPELCPQIWSRLPKRELLFIAGLFHDIAKGRGGDHSELGKKCVEEFCRSHEYPAEDEQLVAWLVENHLLMSLTAQRKDITDWQVISQFAALCQNQKTLDHLYLLTVADIQATNPKLWNSWRASLLHRLYIETLHAFDKALLQPQTRQDVIHEKQQQALQQFKSDQQKITDLWAHWGEEYFLQNTLEAIIWHTQLLLAQDPLKNPISESCQHNALGVTEIFVSAPRTPSLFALVASIVDQLDLNIVSATLTTTDEGISLDNYYVLETNGRPITEKDRIREIKVLLQSALQRSDETPIKTNRRSFKSQHHFRQPAKVFIAPHPHQDYLELNVIAQDRPGLLGLIASHLAAHHYNVLRAKINTLGERVEDVFSVTSTQAGDHKEFCKDLEQSIDAYLKMQR